ncbi:MAG: DUF1189 domain-containing protein [bacterium]|nr:DUF1189 domain-containing protein [bacterium]
MDCQNVQKAPNIFQSFIYAFIPPKYQQLVKVKTGGMIAFVVLLVLIVTLADFAVLGGVIGVGYIVPLWEKIPDIVIDDGKLQIDQEYFYAKNGTYVSVTNDANAYTYEDVMALAQSGYTQILIVDQDKIIVLQQGEYQERYFTELADRGEKFIFKDWLKEELLPVMGVSVAVLLVIYFSLRVIWYFLSAAVYLLGGMVIAQIMGKKLPTEQLFRIAVYAKVPMYMFAMMFNGMSLMSFSVSLFPRMAAAFIFMFIRIVATLAFIGVTIYNIPQEGETGAFTEGTISRT